MKKRTTFSAAVFGLLTGVLILILLIGLIGLTGCVTEREIVYKTIYFADTNGVTTIYFPISMEKDLRTPHDDERWRYVASRDIPDNGKPKLMIELDSFAEQQKLSDEYHKLHPECDYKYSH